MDDVDTRWRAELLRRAAEHTDDPDAQLALAQAYEDTLMGAGLRFRLSVDALKASIREYVRRNR